jgi:hypothetical protein
MGEVPVFHQRSLLSAREGLEAIHTTFSTLIISVIVQNTNRGIFLRVIKNERCFRR